MFSNSWNNETLNQWFQSKFIVFFYFILLFLLNLLPGFVSACLKCQRFLFRARSFYSLAWVTFFYPEIKDQTFKIQSPLTSIVFFVSTIQSHRDSPGFQCSDRVAVPCLLTERDMPVKSPPSLSPVLLSSASARMTSVPLRPCARLSWRLNGSDYFPSHGFWSFLVYSGCARAGNINTMMPLVFHD